MDKCEYSFEFPCNGPSCMVYLFSKRPDGRLWAHCPTCSSEKCPLEHPELLEGAIFDKEAFDKAIK